MHFKIAILILAAGKSTRMDVTKQLLKVGSTTLVGLAIENAKQSKTDSIYCILGANAEKIKTSIKHYEIETIINPNYEQGLSASIISGINHISSKDFDAALIMLGDQPTVTSNYLNKLIDSFNKNPDKISVSNYNGKIGVPAIFPRNYFKQLTQLKGDKGARELLLSEKENCIQLFHLPFIDIDTEEEYQNFLTSIKK
ncbi:nucleotidyltransferase family protein [Tenacibaculum sp. IB213877]|uniref:nucleotidyltransferase family protein n=1 Tax=Tenacibaculum sp. IB213877 TaxID=3097351 RepID=UPI002A59ADC3|nr:nucleotidyltransferase family protein [Tenacibaculum sp. IB213877]MDY0780898.1 nucleotidyltransferase family protein [Tenacibaculum sp. IB213877]